MTRPSLQQQLYKANFVACERGSSTLYEISVHAWNFIKFCIKIVLHMIVIFVRHLFINLFHLLNFSVFKL